MKKLLTLLLLVAFGVSSDAALESQVQSLIQEADPSLIVGIEVQTLEGEKPILSFQAERPYVTASTQKILPVSVAFSTLTDTSFATEFHYDAKNDESYLIFNGDPLLTLKDLTHIIGKAKAKGMLGKKIYILKSHPQEGAALPPTSPGCTYEAMDFCHGGVFSTAIVNQNRALFDFDGNSTTGKALVNLHEGQPPFAVKNDTFVRDICFNNEKVGKWDQVQRTALDFNGVKISIKGCASRDFKATMCLPVEAHELDRYLRLVIQTALKNNHVTLPIEFAATIEGNCTKKFQYTSSTLLKLLKLSLQDSHNLTTDALFSKVTQKKEWPRNWTFAGKTLMEKMHDLFGVTFDVHDEISSGSGFSFYNRLMPKTFIQILRKTRKKLGDKFLEIFPEAGVNGTIKNRLKDLQGVRILGKTGHLNGVSNFVGYIEREGKEPLVFAIFVQGFAVDPKVRRGLIDDVIKLVASV